MREVILQSRTFFMIFKGTFPFNEQKYADFMWEIGVLGYEIVKNKRNLTPELVNHNLKRLQNFSWWTYEYGC